VKERAAYVSAPFSGHYAVVLREDLGKFFATIKDPHTGLTCVVAEIPYDLLDKALTESEPHNDGAPVAVGDKLIEFEGVQTFMQLRDSTSRVTLESYLSRRPMMPRDVLNPEKHSFDLRIYTTLMNRLTSGLVDRLNLFNSLPRRSEGRPQGRRFVMWQDEYLSSPNAHPGDWLPEAYVFHERGADQSDDDYFVSILKKMNLSFKEELERQVHDYFGVPAPVDGEILSVTLRQPDVFGKQGYDVVFVGCDGHRRIYTLPWTASFPVRGLERGPKLGPIKARELMAYALTFGSTRIQTMRNEEHLLPLCDGNKDLATTLLYRLGLLLVQCRCEPAFCEEISGGKPGLMLSARYLESKAGHLPNEQFIWWDMRPLLPYYRGDLGCAILPWIKLGSVGHVWRTMAFTCNMCRLNFIPHIGNKVDEDLIGFPFDLIKAGHCRPRSGAPVYAVAKAS
jgi:hypothetical protein